MAMLLIRGRFKAEGGAKPDGDTLPFIPDDVDDWRLVPGDGQVVPKADGRANVRLEGIDALETHYGEDPHVEHQPLGLAHKAADELLKFLGFGTVLRDDDETVATSPDSVPGWILTRGADAYGRCVAFVGKGTPPVYSGYWTGVDEDLLERTANHRLLLHGLAYPTFYSGLPLHLRELLTEASEKARASAKGVWQADRTLDGVKVMGMDSLTDDKTGAVILPKLFRRLKDYLDFMGKNPSLECFRAFLAGVQDEYRLPDSGKLHRGLHHIVEVTPDNTVKMTRRCKDIVFVEK
ncbi:thermonuclease family protein [Streptomyces akebiae]|uniref:Thermonuclease family protein n=1 Tax=Streptomyces akebiae TaxID=2865673 RepID=A0ABX8XZF2_9ACTN|nr:thermonuclease family protein [Streptomyces akebiae]QYX80967.1 thermonuclease family protein [Streptomyces akebiae]